MRDNLRNELKTFWTSKHKPLFCLCLIILLVELAVMLSSNSKSITETIWSGSTCAAWRIELWTHMHIFITRSWQLLNAVSWIILTAGGMMMHSRDMHDSNASTPISSILSPRVTVFNNLQRQNATVLGMLISLSDVHFSNASSPIFSRTHLFYANYDARNILRHAFAKKSKLVAQIMTHLFCANYYARNNLHHTA